MKNQNNKIPAAGYARVSTSEQDKKQTHEIQRNQIKNYCAAQSWEIYKIYQDTISGSEDERPALNELLADAEKGKFQKVVFTKLDRFGRSLKFILSCYEKLGNLGIGVVSISESIDTSTPVGVLLRNILGTLAEFEAKRIAERMYEGRYLKTAQGQSIPGREPYGYRWKDGKAVLDEDEAAVVKKMFSYYLENRLAIRHLVERLNREGFKTRRGKYWQGSSVTKILRNPVYTGQAVFFKQHSKPILIQCPRLITEAEHKRVLELMEENNTRREMYPRNLRKDDPFLLRGLLTCGRCGSKMLSLWDGSSRVRRYICHWSKRKKWTDLAMRDKKCDLPAVDAAKLEALVLDLLTYYLTKPGRILDHIKSESVNTGQMEKELGKLKAKITQANDGLRRLYGLYEERAIDKKDLLARLSERKGQISELEEKKKELEKHLAMLNAKTAEAKSIKDDFKKIVREGILRVDVVLDSMTRDQMKEFLRTAIEGRLTVKNAKAETLGDVSGTFAFGRALAMLGNFRNPKLKECGSPRRR